MFEINDNDGDKMAPDERFDGLKAQVYTVMNIGPKQGEMLNLLLAAAYQRGRCSGLRTVEKMIDEMQKADETAQTQT